MASTAALLIAALALPAVAAARGAQSDPGRRSLVVEAVEKASPAVVNVSTEQIVEQRRSPFPFPQDPFFEEFFRDFVDPRPRRFKTTSLGSGVIVAADGTIMTNVHVIERASRIHVTLIDQREFDATPVGADADADIAILRVKAGDDLPHIPFGSSADLMIGETVIAIGNHFGVRRGVVVAQLDPKSPAEAAGVARGDAIIKVDGRDVASREEFEQRIDDHTEGDRITLTLRRDGRDEEVGLAAATLPRARAD